MAIPDSTGWENMEPVSPRFTHVYGLCPSCADARDIPATTAREHEITCGWCGAKHPAIEWVERGRAERERMGFDAPPPLDAE